MKFILILILHTPVYGYYNNSAVTLQEFDSQTQCEYAAKLIREKYEDENYNPEDFGAIVTFMLDFVTGGGRDDLS